MEIVEKVIQRMIRIGIFMERSAQILIPVFNLKAIQTKQVGGLKQIQDLDQVGVIKMGRLAVVIMILQ